MDKKKYLEELLEGAGHLNQFPMKTTDKSPDYGGYIKIEDKIYRLSAWVKTKRGKKLNKKDLLSTNIATKHCYCTQLCYMNTFSTHIKPGIEIKNTER